MTEEEFSALSLPDKWAHIHKTMDYIVQTDSKYSSTKNMFDMRKRYNPHHPAAQVEEETRLFKEQQRNLRIDQHQRWSHIKALYSINRDELSDTLGIKDYEESKRIMERIFTLEVDDALRDIIDES